MRTSRKAFRQFLSENFNGLHLKKPLFYNWPIGLRFDLQSGEPGTDAYFDEVTKRATALFQQAFAVSDNLFLVLVDYKYRRRKIRLSTYAFRQVSGLVKREVLYAKVRGLYEPEDKFDVRNMAIIALDTERINYKAILSAIGNHDFPPRQPRFDANRYLSDKEVYFVNIDKKLIFDMYDDRGLDILAADKTTLQPLYEQHKDWLLDYDREQMNQLFETGVHTAQASLH